MILDENTLDNTAIRILDLYINNIKDEFKNEYELDVDILSYTGGIQDAFTSKFKELIERIKNSNKNANDKLVVVLSTPGGSATAVERMVTIIRHHYNEVYFIVPEAAMSAGTIFSMSGDKIFMDYASSLGPIDPQVQNDEGKWVPALGYIDKIQELVAKSASGDMSDAEFVMFQKLDLGTLRGYEQARDLSVSLLKEWLVKYKFKDWNTHRTNNPGSPVTAQEKQTRAEEIARKLSDNNRWHTHGRYISIETLRDELKLEIEDYTGKVNLRYNITEYAKLLNDYVAKKNRGIFFHAKL